MYTVLVIFGVISLSFPISIVKGILRAYVTMLLVNSWEIVMSTMLGLSFVEKDLPTFFNKDL